MELNHKCTSGYLPTKHLPMPYAVQGQTHLLAFTRTVLFTLLQFSGFSFDQGFYKNQSNNVALGSSTRSVWYNGMVKNLT